MITRIKGNNISWALLPFIPLCFAMPCLNAYIESFEDQLAFFLQSIYGEVDIRICVSQVTPRQYAHL